MRNLEVKEIKEVKGGNVVRVALEVTANIITVYTAARNSRDRSHATPGTNSGADAQGNQIHCPGGTSPHMGDHGDYKGPHCDRVDG